MVNIRIYDYTDGRYIHADDLLRLLEECPIEPDPIMAEAIPRFHHLIRVICNQPGSGQPAERGDCAQRGPLTGMACALPYGHRGDHRTADGLGGWHNDAR